MSCVSSSQVAVQMLLQLSFMSVSRSFRLSRLGCSGDLVSLLSNGPYKAYDGLFWWLVGDTSWTY